MRDGRRRRIHVIPESTDLRRLDVCAALRLISPFSHPAIASNFDVSIDITPPADKVDILVLQRLGAPTIPEPDLEDLVWDMKHSGAKLLYDIDDNLLDQHPDHDVDYRIAGRRRIVRLLLREADHVTVSTAPLRNRILGFNSSVSVLPNALDLRRLPDYSVRRQDERRSGFTVGYFGTFTHLRDLMSVVAPVRAAFSALPERPTLVLCGISLDTRILSLFDDVATIKVLPPTDDYQEFLNVMQSQKWDLGLAPLAAGRFEAAKSDIKLLDYAAFGIPGLYADHPAYATVQNNVTGMVAAADNWADCILRIARDPAFAAKIVAESRAYVFSQRTLDRTVPGLATILEQLASEPQ